MSEDVFKFNARFNGGKIVQAKEMKLTVAGAENNSTDYLVQNVSIQYGRPIQTLRELSTPNMYYHTLPPAGTVSIGRIVGRTPITSILGASASGIWTAPSSLEGESNAAVASRVVQLKRIAGGSNSPTYTMEGCIVQALSAATDVNGNFVQESVTIIFGKMGVN